MKNITQHTGKLEIVCRKPSSKMGNPRYLVRLDGWLVSTMPDSMDAYAASRLEGKKVTAEIGTHYGVASISRIRECK